MHHSAVDKSSQKQEVRSATLERNKKGNTNTNNNSSSNIRWDLNKAGKPDDRLKVPDPEIVAENPVEVKKTESGESDPGYESDSNTKSGIKNPVKVDAKIVPKDQFVNAPGKNKEPLKGHQHHQQQQQQHHHKQQQHQQQQHLVVTKQSQKVVQQVASSSSSSEAQPRKFNTLDRLDKKNKLVKLDKVEKQDRLDRFDWLEKHRQDKLNRLDKQDKTDKLDQIDRKDKLDRLDRQDKQDKEDIFNKIISPNLIEELANVKDAAAPVTLEIFSPVMVSWFRAFSIFFRSFIFHLVPSGKKEKKREREREETGLKGFLQPKILRNFLL